MVKYFFKIYNIDVPSINMSLEVKASLKIGLNEIGNNIIDTIA